MVAFGLSVNFGPSPKSGDAEESKPVYRSARLGLIAKYKHMPTLDRRFGAQSLLDTD